MGVVVKQFPFTDVKLDGLQEKIFLDRYAAKETDPKQWKTGVKVVALLSEDPKNPLFRKTIIGITRGITFVEGMKGAYVDLDDVTTGERQNRVHSDNIEYPKEQIPAESWHRIATALASVEKPSIQQRVYDEFAYALNDFKLVPGGRVNAGAGTDELTLMNCFVIPSPHDSRGGIMRTLEQMTEIMSRGGGVGINLSTLRPKRSLVAGVNGHSSGAVSWGGLFSFTTGLIEQGGSRRGALMLMINDWHPDVLSFITAKQQSGKIENANMSVCVSNAFMYAVKANGNWKLEFPDTSHPAYNTEWNGDLRAWKQKGYPVTLHATVKAAEMWDMIITSAWKSAEPGIWFSEYSNHMSNSWYFNPLICTNPCGEQSLPAWGVCNLSAINLSKFYDPSTHDVNWKELGKVVRIGVRFTDNVTTATMYPLPEQAENQRAERRSGLGTMGLAELMIKLGIRYGSPEGGAFLNRLYGFMAKEAYLASADLAEEKGSFEQFVLGKFIESGFMRNLISVYPEVLDAIKRKGIRNVTLITQAPTGSTGTMVGTSTGIEPYYAFDYYRQGRLGIHKEHVPIAQAWLDQHPGEPLPDYFVTAQDLSPADHIRVQAVIQRWTDSSISKTANAPHDFTVEQTKELYELAFDLGCKGVTIYRDGSRDTQVLSTDKKSDAPKGLERAEKTNNEDDFESSKVCEIRYENGQMISDCGTDK